MRTCMPRVTILLPLIALGLGAARTGILAPQNPVTFSGTPLIIVVQSQEADLSPAATILQKSQLDEYIHFKVSLHKGLNHFVIRYLDDSGKVAVETLRVVSHPSRHNRWNVPYSSFHQTSIPDQICSNCHDLNMDEPSTCWDCHSSLVDTTQAELHPPVEDGCSDCHDDYRVTTDVCTDCHEFDEMPKKHAPFAIGDCTVCHNPHGSPNPFFLRMATIPAQCGFCHHIKKYREGTHPVGRHPMESKDLTCVSCHNPHGSSYLKFLVSAPQNFCEKCHESK